jgi:hypothetical protein
MGVAGVRFRCLLTQCIDCQWGKKDNNALVTYRDEILQETRVAPLCASHARYFLRAYYVLARHITSRGAD